MNNLPTGVVTFVMTDVVDSTGKWERAPRVMRRATRRLDAIIESGVVEYGGVLLKNRGEGDSHFAVFADPVDAVSAAIHTQTALHREPWPSDCSLSVRMGVHMGPCEVRDGDYRGPVPNRCAKIRQHGDGGEVLISESVQVAVRGHLENVDRIVQVGEYVVSGSPDPEAMYQVIPESLADETRVLRLGSRGSSQLPHYLSSFVARRAELAELRTALTRGRVVTLLGPGGSGKTRLAVQYVREMDEPLSDGYVYASLEELPSGITVTMAVAQALGMQGRGDTVHEVRAQIGTRSMLLVLDNCETRAAEVSTLLRSVLERCPNLRVLATSRLRLDIPGASSIYVAPLAAPPAYESDMAAVQQFAAVQLFVDRARMTTDRFRLTESNAPDVAELCRALDGLPLAIELAAANVVYLSPRELLTRLPGELGPRSGADPSERHRSLRAVFDSSYSMLGTEDATLFDCLSIFGGTFSIHDVAAMAESLDVLPKFSIEQLSALVDSSLIVPVFPSDRTARFRMLATLRELAREHLAREGWLSDLARWHANHVAADIERLLAQGDLDDELLERLDLRVANVQTAIDWAVEHQESMVGMRLAAPLWTYWQRRGRLAEGRHALERILALPPEDVGPDLRAGAYRGLGALCYHQGDLRDAARAFAQGIEESEKGTDRQLGLALRLNLGMTQSHLGELEKARLHLTAGLEDVEAQGATAFLAGVLYNLGLVTWNLGEPHAALPLLRRARREADVLDDLSTAALTANLLGLISVELGRFSAAEGYYRASRDRYRQIEDLPGVGAVDLSLAELDRLRGRHEEARATLDEIISSASEHGDDWVKMDALQELGHCWLDAGDGARADAALSESLRGYSSTERHMGACRALVGLGRSSLARGDLDMADDRFAEAATRSRDISDSKEQAKATIGRALVAARRGGSDLAWNLLRDALGTQHGMGDVRRSVAGLEYAAVIALRAGIVEPAEQLIAAAAALRDELGFPRPYHVSLELTHARGDVKYEVGQAQAATDVRQSWGLKEAVARVLSASTCAELREEGD